MTARVDVVIAKIREIHRQYKEEGIGKRDVMIFSHGGILVSFGLGCIT